MGRQAEHGKTADALQIDIRRLHREGHLDRGFPITWGWEGGAKIRLHPTRDKVNFDYKYEGNDGGWRDVNQDVTVRWQRCTYGGWRPWFACPRCGWRKAILYLWNVPVCRTCAQLRYRSQSEGETCRSWRRTRKIEAKLSGGAGESNLMKPKGMHWETFRRLVSEQKWEKVQRDRFLVDAYHKLMRRR